MSEPSAVLAAIVTRLRTLLGVAVDVQVNPGPFEGKEYKTVKPATVLVTCTSLLVSAEWTSQPPMADAEFVAFCIAKQAAHPKSQGDIAMDLAALVASHVSRERWGETASADAQRILARNLYSVDQKQDGMVGWSVQWRQQIELTPADVNGVLERLAEINMTFAMGDEDTPDAKAIQEFPV